MITVSLALSQTRA